MWASVFTLPILFIGQMIFGFVLAFMESDSILVLCFVGGIIASYFQYTIFIVFYSEYFRQMLSKVYRGWAQVDADQIRLLENKRLWAISLNPIFPQITGNFKIYVPIIELFYIFYIVGSCFYFRNVAKKGPLSEIFDTQNHGQNFVFFVISWLLFAFPLTSLFLGLLYIAIFGIPLLIYILTEKRSPIADKGQDDQKKVLSFVDSQRCKLASNLSIVESCSICLHNFQKDEIVFALKCHVNHIFHEKCLHKWVETRMACPLCRVKLERIDIEDNANPLTEQEIL